MPPVFDLDEIEAGLFGGSLGAEVPDLLQVPVAVRRMRFDLRDHRSRLCPSAAEGWPGRAWNTMISMEKMRDVALIVASIAATIWFALGIGEDTGSYVREPSQVETGESRFESQVLIQLTGIVEATCQIAYQTAQLHSTGLPVRTAPCP